MGAANSTEVTDVKWAEIPLLCCWITRKTNAFRKGELTRFSR
jgi:hypothetical protein